MSDTNNTYDPCNRGRQEDEPCIKSDVEVMLEEVQAIFDAYDGSMPYPEHYKRYAGSHALRFDHSEAVNLIMPLNDPRRKCSVRQATPEDTIENAKLDVFKERIEPLLLQIRDIARQENAPCILAWQHRENWFTAYCNLPGHQITAFTDVYRILEGKDEQYENA